MVTMQFTLFSTTGKYKPMSTLMQVESLQHYQENKRQYLRRAVAKIGAERKMPGWCIKEYGYTQMKARVYDKDKIEQDKKARYEAIKKERGWS